MSEFIQQWFVDAIVHFNQFKTNAVLELNRIRSEYVIVAALSNFVEILANMVNILFLWATRLRLEPIDTPFISVYSYDQTTRKTGEKIVFIHSQEDCREKYQKLVEETRSSTTLIVARVVSDVVRIRLATGADVETDIK